MGGRECHLAAATALTWCGEEHAVTTLATRLPGNGGSTQMLRCDYFITCHCCLQKFYKCKSNVMQLMKFKLLIQ
jgi:hypothetical protein